MTTIWIALSADRVKLWLEMLNRNRNHPTPVEDVEPKPRFVDRVFGLLEGPVATSLVKLIATGFISATTVSIVAILAFTSAPISMVLSAAGLGSLSIAIVWIFGKRPKPSDLSNQKAFRNLEAKLAELETRLANVEIIERFEDRLAAKASARTPEPGQASATTTYSSAPAESER